MSQAVIERPQSRSRSWWIPGLAFGIIMALLAALVPQASAQVNTVTLRVPVSSDRTQFVDRGTGANALKGRSPLPGVVVTAVEASSGQSTPSSASALKTASKKWTGVTDSTGWAEIEVPYRQAGYWVAATDVPDTHFVMEQITTADYTGKPAYRGGNVHHSGTINKGVSTVQVPNTKGQDRVSSENVYGDSVWTHHTLTVPRKNPELQRGVCEAGLDMTIMVDLSYSARPYMSAYRAGLVDFVDSVAGTPGMNVTLATFAGDSPAHNAGNPTTYDVSTSTGVSSLKRKINNLNAVSPSNNNRARQGTNWDMAFWKLNQDADLVLFVTDGMPTMDAGDRGRIGSSKKRNVEMAVTSANRLKNSGVRVVTAAVGDAVPETAIPNLIGISGPQEGRDYYRTDWTRLGDTLKEGLNASCVPGLDVTKTSDPAPGTLVKDGEEITYTVTAENTGEIDLNTVITDDLSQVLNNAEFLEGQASSGELVFHASDTTPSLDWSGFLAVGESVSITYTVVVDSGGQEVVLENAVTGTGNPVDNSAPITVGPISVDHYTEYSPVIIPNPGYLIDKTSDPVSGTLVSGNEEITYTITGVNNGNVDLNAELHDDLSEVLAHADLTSEPVASTGEVSFTGTDIYWTGSLAEGQAVEIVYTVTTHPGVGNVLINNVVNGEATPIDPEHGTEPIIPEEVRTEHPTPELIETPENRLPDTGGAGVWALVIGGLIMAVIGGAIWLIWSRRD